MLSKNFFCLLWLISFCAPTCAQTVEGNESLSLMDPVSLQVAPELQLPSQPLLPLKLNGRSTSALFPAPQVPARTVFLSRPVEPPRKRRKRRRSPTVGQLKAPLDGRLTVAQGFGLHGNMFNRGIDFVSTPGSSVRSTDSGLVLYAGNRIVVIGHGPKCRSRYLFLSEVAVKSGDPVKQGAMLGKVGSTPLHFEYWLKTSTTAWHAQDAAVLLKLTMSKSKQM